MAVDTGQYLSITRAGIRELLAEARRLMQSAGYRGELTSHTLQALFTSKLKDAKGEACVSAPEPFHPAQRWPHHYSKEVPTIVVTYTWAMDLETELGQFMDQAERLLGLSEAEATAATWWLDILFNDQNGGSMEDVLERARLGYQRARFHVAFLLNGIFTRGWCCAELAYRIQVPQRAQRCPRWLPSAGLARVWLRQWPVPRCARGPRDA
jgi:hypothetical protein